MSQASFLARTMNSIPVASDSISTTAQRNDRFLCPGCHKWLKRSTWFGHKRKSCGKVQLPQLEGTGPIRPSRSRHKNTRAAPAMGRQRMSQPQEPVEEQTRHETPAYMDGDGGDAVESRVHSPQPEGTIHVHSTLEEASLNDRPEALTTSPPADPGSLADLEREIQEGVDPEVLLPPEDAEEPSPIPEDPGLPYRGEARIEEFRITEEFIAAIEAASLDNDFITNDVRDRLRNPCTEELKIENPGLRLSLELYLADMPEDRYTLMRDALRRTYPEVEMLSYDQIRRKVQEISGIHPVFNDMCINSCLGFVGPFADNLRCPTCGQHRYDQARLMLTGKTVPRKQFLTNLIGPQIQAAYRSRESALDMTYRSRCTAKLMEELEASGHTRASQWSDYVHGTEYIDAVQRGDISDTDTALMLSLDGAQLYQNKQSDCWMYIWVFLDRAPENRYKKPHVMIGGVIPGPNKPKNIDSFLFPGFHHLAALMRDGVVVWDAARNIKFLSRPFLAFLTADGPGMTYLNGLVGHSGAQGCRLYCKLKGRHKPHVGIYYPALQKPRDYDISGCDHPDVNLPELASRPYTDAIKDYHTNLEYVRNSANPTQYRQRRRETGIAKPSIVSGLPENRVFPMPGCFPADLMHLASLNLTDLIVSLLRGSLQCDTAAGDHMELWDWAVLRDQELWQAHGQAVADATPYLPGSFDRPPRNPAEKIKSGYKAVEFLTYIFGLGPALFYNILPHKYWKSFCKLVRGIRLIHQREIQLNQLTEAHKLLIEYSIEFEDLYYQRHPGRLHFVRQAVHALCHICMEIMRIGPYTGVTQWTMERTIGDLGQEIRQPSNPYGNLAQRALRRCQVNALRAMVPDLHGSQDKSQIPRGAHALANGYVLLRACDRYAHTLPRHEALVLVDFLRAQQVVAASKWWSKPKIVRWARLRLPNGQVARTLWKERLKPLDRLRMSRNVKFLRNGIVCFAEVLWFCELSMQSNEPSRGFAMVDMYSPPDNDLLAESSGTLWSCIRQDDHAGLALIDVESIQSVVAVVPHTENYGENITGRNLTGRMYVVEKMGLDVMTLAGLGDDVDDNEEDVEE